MSLRILVIDDDEAIRLSVEVLLRAKGYEVFLGADGADGFAKFVESQPHVVISDMIMPGHASIETIGKIRAMKPDVAIIAMSGSIKGGPDSYLERAIAAGADHYLDKPFEAAQLMSLLHDIEKSGRGP
ncbi:response regulator [Sphingomonas sp. HF-S4]|uniref:Response regulator n=1 Tax=Sphingomonas agrestis TaxID=3080540 RepID=A0ABU3Y8F0_9SPHN|nr:response regulator [Sphingomonas sp. HF-S4]MDV3457607.1 response regulator [Sphingomonas sp. HF-S4]